MEMTVLEWLRSSTMYSSFEDRHFIKIALDRGVDPSASVYDESQVSKKQRDLMSADMITMVVLNKPTNTASKSHSHNGYQKTIGGEQDYRLDDKIKYALSIYNRYDDEMAQVLDGVRKKIRFIPIVDVDKL